MKTENLIDAAIIGLLGIFIVAVNRKQKENDKKQKQREEERRKASSYQITIYKLPKKMSRVEAEKSIENIIEISAKALDEETKFENN